MARMPRVARFDDQLPLAVEVAIRCFGSPVAVALLQHFQAEGTRAEAVEALGLTATVAQKHVSNLVMAGALLEVRAPSGQRGGRYRTDATRVADLLQQLGAYLGAEPGADR